jgi:hypothetical protein
MWLKNVQFAGLEDKYLRNPLIFRGLHRFSTARPKLPPKSVGASVDKVFAIRYRPRVAWLSGVRSKNNQSLLKTLLLYKSRIFFGFCGESYASPDTCPH